ARRGEGAGPDGGGGGGGERARGAGGRGQRPGRPGRCAAAPVRAVLLAQAARNGARPRHRQADRRCARRPAGRDAEPARRASHRRRAAAGGGTRQTPPQVLVAALSGMEVLVALLRATIAAPPLPAVGPPRAAATPAPP